MAKEILKKKKYRIIIYTFDNTNDGIINEVVRISLKTCSKKMLEVLTKPLKKLFKISYFNYVVLFDHLKKHCLKCLLNWNVDFRIDRYTAGFCKTLNESRGRRKSRTSLPL